ncbi:pectinesterase inhibitor-like [Sesamum indicum]|uniref:Pectinesterase inhibitor-like n=1 Tax=Sesamum indicum TaxID=4182 RepID=A0A6I9SWC3_SESIN|nr:pectinesterase inhibitor-like [Sesamum indicum]
MSSSLFLLVSISVALLWSYPVFVESDLRADAQAKIQEAVAATQAVIQVVKSVETGGNKQIVETCIEVSSDAIDNLNDVKSLLPKARDPRSLETVRVRATAAFTDVGTCDDEFGDREPAQVAAATKKAQDIINQLIIILNKL